MHRARRLARTLPWLLLTCLGCRAAPTESGAEGQDALPTIEAHTAGLRAVDGFVPLWWSERDGRVLLELPPSEVSFLYWTSLPFGLGSNDVGLDRGQVGTRRVLHTLRVGRRVLLVEPNLTWRSSSEDPAVQRAARESFAESVVFGFDLVARSGERLLVEGNDLLLRDAHRIAGSLQRAGQGRYTLDRARSAVLGDGLRGFPDNTELDCLQTFASETPGREVAATSADPLAASLRVRHSFLRLPDDGYRARRFHPRSGFSPSGWNDLSAPIDAPMRQNHITRHRLQKRDPTLASSAPVDPIVYYIDRGAPEPVRTALLEGARYWESVFERAGFPGGFRAELMPEGADPHDARYNVVQWVNRSTRGWSYGNGVSDPRSGEILKGHVTLGALRVRQDVLLGEGLLSPYAGGADDPRAREMALARIRQLSAHEIGHTLGLAHNFAASATGRASVMDYPAPVVTLDGSGALELGDAYRDGCGEWDELAIRYGYGDFTHLDPGGDPAAREAAGLRAVLDEARERGLWFLTDRDARGSDRAHPLANLWDNGADPVEYLEHELAVRRAALERLSADALKPGRALAELEEVLVPLYLHHRYQLEAAVRALGGVEYAYDLRGEPSTPRVAVDAARQRRALELALRTLEPEFLELPARLLQLVPARPPGLADHRERVRPGALLLDPLELADASLETTLALLLDPGRCARLVDQRAADPGQLGLEDVFGTLFELGWGAGREAGELRAQLRFAFARHLMTLAADEQVPLRVREPAMAWLQSVWGAEGERSLLGVTIARYIDDPAQALATLETPRVPPGSPIGCGWGPEVS